MQRAGVGQLAGLGQGDAEGAARRYLARIEAARRHRGVRVGVVVAPDDQVAGFDGERLRLVGGRLHDDHVFLAPSAPGGGRERERSDNPAHLAPPSRSIAPRHMEWRLARPSGMRRMTFVLLLAACGGVDDLGGALPSAEMLEIGLPARAGLAKPGEPSELWLL